MLIENFDKSLVCSEAVAPLLTNGHILNKAFLMFFFADKAKPSSIKTLGFPFYYYDGNAHESNVQEVIKSQFHALISGPYVSPYFCIMHPKCTKDSISVSPGVIGICILLL